MVIFEIQHEEPEDTAALAVYGKLHRLLGTNPSRRLLGPEAVATMTSSNFLVVHHRHAGPWLYEYESKNGVGRGGGGAGSRLALGDRRWDICGIDRNEPSTESLMRASWKKHETPGSDARRLEGVIESVVKVASRADVFSVELAPKARPRRRKEQEGGAPTSSMIEKTQKRLQRFYARFLAEKALVRTPPPKEKRRNPLMLVGVGALLSRVDCETILGEAQEKNEWAHWDGDLGGDAEATSLEHLPLSRALWSGEAGDAVRARIAGFYGVHQSSVAVGADDVFVCKVGPEGCGRAEMQGRRQRRTGRRKAAIDVAPQQQQQQQQQLSATVEFRRSKSLIAFCVALSAEETPPWAVCVEQRRQCLRPNGQGAGVVFSGKLRHACVTVSPETRAEQRSGADGGNLAQANPSVVLLRGFASIQHPSVPEDVARWEWGSPAWHVDAPWIKDQDILDRAWVGGGGRVGGGVVEAVGATVEGMTPPAETVVTSADSYSHLERLNTSVAHRYYRQGLGGMDVPIVDPLGRPVIDLVEGISSWLPGAKKTGDVTVSAVLRRRFPWDRRRQVGKAGLSTAAGASPVMDAALQELFGELHEAEAAAVGAGERFARVPVPPIKYVFVDPRYRGLGLGRRLFLEAMRSLARRGFRFALIIVEDNGSGGLFGFYEEMGFVRADELLGLPRAMIAPIPPPDDVL
ncbi:unnamed protein product [Laminaria digitata]